ncbi:PD-(D/E)XK motif protein [Pontibacter beigongshangensis]|uniref:PD-(D/E)XK motif protein n=1 Tax=Pontibacter beigongshangensis TaxID=2574733 RepID=UPI00164F55C1|nr:PD-(D/E)XK motif protein [Pontibacter beigongshangensis]
MTNARLEKLWIGLNHSGQSEFEFKRVDSICIPELNVGLSSNLQRCLILELPKGFSGNWPEVVKDNLSLFWYPETGYIIIQLLDANYNDLFDDLILSIYRNISGLSQPSDYITNMIRIFNKWSGFFIDSQTGRMQTNVLRGLIGELLVLRDMLTQASYATVNNVLSSWRGPYDQARDFISDRIDTEVKTTDGNSDIHISSEFQLQPEPDKELHLAVVELELDLADGISLRILVNELRHIIDNLLGDTSLLLRALFQKGLTYHNLFEYDNLRFKARRIIIYDCLQSAFPVLINSELPAPIYQVSYRLRLASLTDFIIQVKEL